MQAKREQRFFICLYSPDSPDLNPVEKLWAKVKSILRKLQVRSLGTLDAAISVALNCASENDCAGWFRCAGYCLF